MNRQLRYFALSIIVAAVAGVAGGWIGARYVNPGSAEERSLHALVHDDLDLTAEQARRLDGIENRFAVRRQLLEAELRQANAELATAVRTSHRYGPEVQAAVNHFHSTMGTLQSETMLHVFEMRSVLTPEQAEMFDRRIADALTQDAT